MLEGFCYKAVFIALELEAQNSLYYKWQLATVTCFHPILTPALYLHQPMEVSVDETKLTLHGLQQYYVKLKDAEKNRKLFQILDDLEFNQVSSHFVPLSFLEA